MNQVRIPTVFYRGGTSKALFLRREDLPSDAELRDRVILAAYGSPDPFGRQLNGIGGATSSTSKVAVVGPSERADADVDYEFGQVGIDAAIIDRGGNCGNISSAVGPYAIEEGLVAASEPITEVRIFNTNTRKIIVAHVPVADGGFEPEGDYAIKGVPGSGSKIVLDYLDPGGSVTGKLLPSGRVRDVFAVPGVGEIEATVIDCSNPQVICRLEAFGLTGLETPDELNAQPELLRRFEALRGQAAVVCGLASTPEEALQRSPAIPRVVLVTSPKACVTTEGERLEASDMDLLGRNVSMGRVHASFALTSAIATIVAALVPGTVAALASGRAGEGSRADEWASGRAGEKDAETRRRGDAESAPPSLVEPALSLSKGKGAEGLGPDAGITWVRLAHPAGVLDELGAQVELVDGEWSAIKVSSARTARRLMDGGVYVPRSVWGTGRGDAGTQGRREGEAKDGTPLAVADRSRPAVARP